jgi:protein TonB
MQDRVAEVLAQRRSLESGATGAAIALSLLLHGAMTAAAIWAALHASLPQTTGVVNIRFTPMLRPAAVTTKPIESPVAPPKKVETPKIKEPVAPVKPTAAKPEPKTVPLSNFGKSTKKGSEHPPAPPPAPAAAAPAHPGIGSVTTTSGAEVVGLEGGDFPYTIYIENMKRLIGSRWFHPQIAGAGIATVYFTIQRDGTIRDAKTETSSGNSTFDRAALRAVLESSPLPPLPFGYGGTFLGVHLTFK